MLMEIDDKPFIDYGMKDMEENDNYQFYWYMNAYHYNQWLYYHFLCLRLPPNSEDLFPELEYHYTKLEEYDKLIDEIEEKRRLQKE